MKFSNIAFLALTGVAAAKKVQVAVTGYYNGIDTIGGSGMPFQASEELL